MRISKSAAAIVGLVALNMALGSVVAYQSLHKHSAHDSVVYADHLRRIKVDGKVDDMVRVTLGVTPATNSAADTARSSTELVLTPRAAIELHTQLGRMLLAYQKSIEDRTAKPRSVDRVL